MSVIAEGVQAVAMRCSSCGSEKLGQYTGEIAIHFPGRDGLDKPLILIFPRVLVCLDCGIGEFAVPDAELRQLVEGGSPADSS